MKTSSVSAATLAALACLTISGCASAPSPQMKDSMGWVHQHKGEGTRRVLMGTETELMDEATKILDLSFTVTREPHALFAKFKDTGFSFSFSYAFYFYPSPVSGRTEVEALVANKQMTADAAQGYQKSALADYFPLASLSTRLLDPGFDPNAKEGYFLPLSTAAFYGSVAIARRLIEKGADPEAAINELKTSVSANREYRDRAENNRTYEKSNEGVALLEGLKSNPGQADATKAPPVPAVPKAASGKGDIADRLRKLDDLKRQGLVTEEEYKRKKQELLDQL